MIMQLHLDESVLTELEDIMEEEFEMLIRTYLVDAEKKIDLIEVQLSAADDKNLRESAHSLKGSSLNIGAQPLSVLCGDLETFALEAQIDDALAILPGLRAEYHEVRTVLEARLSN